MSCAPPIAPCARVRPRSPARPLVAVFDGARELLPLYGEVLGEAGFDTWLSTAPPDLTTLAAVHPAAILTELQIGVERADGLAFVVQVGADPRLADIPVVACTAATHIWSAHAETLRERGVPVLTKPFDLDDLLTVVSGAIAGPTPVAAALAEEEAVADERA
jgi:CheY-like chemotaxis protein